MHPAARVVLGVLALWTLFKTPLLFIAAEGIRRHLQHAPDGIRRLLRNRMIGSYGAGLVNVMILLVAATTAITGTTIFIGDFTVVLMAVLAVGVITGFIGIKAAFDSLHDPAIDEFEHRYGIVSSMLLRLGRSVEN